MQKNAMLILLLIFWFFLGAIYESDEPKMRICAEDILLIQDKSKLSHLINHIWDPPITPDLPCAETLSSAIARMKCRIYSSANQLLKEACHLIKFH